MRIALLLGAFGMACVGLSVSVNGLLTGYPVLTNQVVRYAIGGLLLAPLLRRRPAVRSLRTADVVRLAALATTGMVGFNLAILMAERSTEPAAVGVLIGTAPLVLAVLGAVQAGRRPAGRVVGAAGLVVAGTAVVEGWGHATAVGLLGAVLAAAGEVLFSLLAAPLVAAFGAVRVTVYACVAATAEALVLGVALDPGGLVSVPTGREALALLYLGVMVTAVAFVCWYTTLNRLGVDRAGLLCGLIPVFTALTAPLVGTGSLGLPQLAGSALVGAAVAIGVSQPSSSMTASTPVSGPGAAAGAASGSTSVDQGSRAGAAA
jgi:drug/metabolite transporter (DMT)-like permease